MMSSANYPGDLKACANLFQVLTTKTQVTGQSKQHDVNRRTAYTDST